MQLLVILFLLLSGGKPEMLGEIKPLIGDVAGDEAAKAVEEAQQISQTISAVKSLTDQNNGLSAILNNLQNSPQNDLQKPQNDFTDSLSHLFNSSSPQPKNLAETQNNTSAASYGPARNQFPLSPIITIAPDEILLPLCKYLSEDN